MLNNAVVTARPREGQSDASDHSQPGLARSPDTLIRSMAGRIMTWSPGMQKRYGFTAEQAHGHISHRLLETAFPRPLQEIEAVFRQQRIWTGALIHRHADGRPILAVNHWYLHCDESAHASLVTEVHSDIARTGDGVPCDLADVVAALAQEFDEMLIALKSCVDGAELTLRAGWPDLKHVREKMARAPAQMARGTETVRLLRTLADGIRATG